MFERLRKTVAGLAVLAVLAVLLGLAGCTQSVDFPGLEGNQTAPSAGVPWVGNAVTRAIPVCPASGLSGSATRCHAHVVADSQGLPVVTATPAGYSPTQIRHAYGFDLSGSNGAGQTIAIVDAFDDPTIANDLAVFKSTFGITGCNLTKVDQNGGTSFPAVNAGWALEISLDVEWVCAIAPGANILLVEANDNSAFSGNLDVAVAYAAAHAQVVSMS